MAIELKVSLFRPVFGDPEGAKFAAIVPRSIFDLIKLTGSAGYSEVLSIAANADEIPQAVSSLNGPHHIFCITADTSFYSPPQEDLANAKLGVLPMFSTGFSVSKLERALQIIFQLDYKSQYNRSKQLISHLNNADNLILEFGKYETISHFVRKKIFLQKEVLGQIQAKSKFVDLSIVAVTIEQFP